MTSRSLKLPRATSAYAIEKQAAALANAALAEGVAQKPFANADYGSYDKAHRAAYALQLAYGRMRSKSRKTGLALQTAERAELPDYKRHLAELDARTPYDTLHSEIIDLAGADGSIFGCALRIKSLTAEDFGIKTPSNSGGAL